MVRVDLTEEMVVQEQTGIGMQPLGELDKEPLPEHLGNRLEHYTQVVELEEPHTQVTPESVVAPAEVEGRERPLNQEEMDLLIPAEAEADKEPLLEAPLRAMGLAVQEL